MNSDGASLTIWGNRQGQSMPGPHSQFWGSTTACYEIQWPSQSLILEGGHGLRQFALHRQPTRADIFLSGVEWDKIQGIPFTPCFYNPKWSAHLWAPPASGQTVLESLLAQQRADLCPVPNFYDPNIGAQITLTAIQGPGSQHFSQENQSWSVDVHSDNHGRVDYLWFQSGQNAILYLPRGAEQGCQYPKANAILLGLVHQSPTMFQTRGLEQLKKQARFLRGDQPQATLIVSNFLPWQLDSDLNQVQLQLSELGDSIYLGRQGQTFPIAP